MRYDVRPAIETDIEKLPDIEQAASELFDETPHFKAAELSGLSVEFLHQQHQNGRLWVAVNGEEPVGFAVVTLIDGLPHLEELSVHPDHGRKGLGTRLVETVCEWVSAKGFKTITLSTFSDVRWNQPFYEKLNFHVVDLSELTDDLAALRAREAEIGLDVEKRVIMRRFI